MSEINGGIVDESKLTGKEFVIHNVATKCIIEDSDTHTELLKAKSILSKRRLFLGDVMSHDDFIHRYDSFTTELMTRFCVIHAPEVKVDKEKIDGEWYTQHYINWKLDSMDMDDLLPVPEYYSVDSSNFLPFPLVPDTIKMVPCKNGVYLFFTNGENEIMRRAYVQNCPGDDNTQASYNETLRFIAGAIKSILFPKSVTKHLYFVDGNNDAL